MFDQIPLELILKQNENKFSSKEKIVAKYLLENLSNIKNIKITTIQKKCKVGASPIYGVFKKIGFSSIDELIELSMQEQVNRTVNSGNKYHNLLQEMYWNVIEKNTQSLNKWNINNFIDSLLKAKIIYVIGIGQSNLGAIMLSRRLSVFGIKIIALESERKDMLTKVGTLNKDDLLISMSISGKTNSIIEATNLAHKNGVKTISISSNRYPNLKDVSDFNINLYIAPFDEKDNVWVSSMIPFIFFIDTIWRKLIESSIQEK